MADTKIVQATVTENIYKRIGTMPEKKAFKLSVSKLVALLIEEALNYREIKKNEKKDRIK